MKEETETDRLSAVKKKETYRRLDLFSVFAILGCAGVLLFELIFIFERYDFLPLLVRNLPIVQSSLTEADDEPSEAVEVAEVGSTHQPAGRITNSPAVTNESAATVSNETVVVAEPAVPVQPQTVSNAPAAVVSNAPAARVFVEPVVPKKPVSVTPEPVETAPKPIIIFGPVETNSPAG